MSEKWYGQPLGRISKRTKQEATSSHQLLSVYRDYGVVLRNEHGGNNNRPPQDHSSYQQVAVGDLVVNKMKAWQGSLGVSDYHGAVSPAYFVYQLAESIWPRFLHYYLRCAKTVSELESISFGVRPNQWDLDPERFKKVEVPAPSLSAQQTTAEYLDYETEQIDEFIADQEHLIELLTERRIATLETACCQGHHQAVQLGHITTYFSSGTSVNATSEPRNEGPGVLKTSAVSKGWFDSSENKSVVDPHEISRLSCHVQSGSVIVNRANTPALVGSAAFITGEHPELFLSDKLWQIDFGANSRFVAFWLQTKQYRDQCSLACVGASSSMQNLSYTDFRGFKIPLPPVEEQERIVAELDRELGEIDEMIADAKLAVELSKEKRAALITAAVTGEIDVSDWQRPDGWIPPHERPDTPQTPELEV